MTDEAQDPMAEEAVSDFMNLLAGALGRSDSSGAVAESIKDAGQGLVLGEKVMGKWVDMAGPKDGEEASDSSVWQLAVGTLLASLANSAYAVALVQAQAAGVVTEDKACPCGRHD